MLDPDFKMRIRIWIKLVLVDPDPDPGSDPDPVPMDRTRNSECFTFLKFENLSSVSKTKDHQSLVLLVKKL